MVVSPLWPRVVAGILLTRFAISIAATLICVGALAWFCCVERGSDQTDPTPRLIVSCVTRPDGTDLCPWSVEVPQVFEAAARGNVRLPRILCGPAVGLRDQPRSR